VSAGPDGCPVQNTVTRKCPCLYDVQFTPRNIGNYDRLTFRKFLYSLLFNHLKFLYVLLMQITFSGT